jgi:hypothetical protein
LVSGFVDISPGFRFFRISSNPAQSEDEALLWNACLYQFVKHQNCWAEIIHACARRLDY